MIMFMLLLFTLCFLVRTSRRREEGGGKNSCFFLASLTLLLLTFFSFNSIDILQLFFATFFSFPGCVIKQFVNVCQLAAASNAIADGDAKEANDSKE